MLAANDQFAHVQIVMSAARVLIVSNEAKEVNDQLDVAMMKLKANRVVVVRNETMSRAETAHSGASHFSPSQRPDVAMMNASHVPNASRANQRLLAKRDLSAQCVRANHAKQRR